MNVIQSDRLSTFQLEGEFVSLIGKPGKKLKYLCITVGDSQLHIKLAKPLRKTLTSSFVRGEPVQVLVGNKFKKNGVKLKLKAYQIEHLSCQFECGEMPSPSPSCSQTATPSISSNYSSPKKGKILLCQKSGCLKRGGKKLHQALEKTIRDLGLENQVKIQATSCQKRCKKAPNMVLMPGKAKYSKIGEKGLSALLEDHYLTPLDPSETAHSQN